MSTSFPYHSLNDYLDIVFENADPTDDQIMRAKKHYWKMYNTDLKRRRRTKVQEFLVGFTQEETQKLKSLIMGEKGIAPLIRTIVLGFLDQNTTIATQHFNTDKIEQSLALIVSYLEEVMEDNVQPHHIANLIQRINHLEILILDY